MNNICNNIYNNIYFTIAISILHLLLIYGIGIIILLATNKKILFNTLVIIIIIKYLYHYFNGCIMTFLENRVDYPSSTQLIGYIITKKDLLLETYDEIIINTGLILIINKLFLLIIIDYYNLNYNF